MRRWFVGLALVMVLWAPAAPAAAGQMPATGVASGNEAVSTGASASDSCWGQATAVFARMGEMGEHASQQPTPRLGLRNLARALYEQGVLADDTLQALGAFVVDALGLSVDACR